MAGEFSPINTADLYAMTQAYTPRVLVDNIFVGTPLWLKFRQNMLAIPSYAYQPLIEYAYDSGDWYDAGDQVGTPNTESAQISTQAKFTLAFFRRRITLNAQSVDLQGSSAIVDLLAAHVRSATESMRMSLAAKLFTGNPAANPTELGGLDYVCDDTATWGGLAPGSYAWWEPHIIEGTSTYAVAVSPSLANLAKMCRSVANTTGERVDMIVVAENFWDKLAGQISANDYAVALASNMNNDVVKWGFSTLFLNDAAGIPIVSDRYATGAAWTAGQSTRATAAGYRAYFLNFNHLKLAFNSRRAFKWDPDGWKRPIDYDQQINFIYFWGNLVGDARRTLGMEYNVDITQEPGDFTASSVTLPG